MMFYRRFIGDIMNVDSNWFHQKKIYPNNRRVPMWSYYGRKSKIISKYHPPIHNKIIEPFAGTACYALRGDNWKKDVLLVDKYDVIINIWKYLQSASRSDVLSLPIPVKGQDIRNINSLSIPERHLMGFSINRGSATPKNIVCNWNSWEKTRNDIAESLHKIKHWELKCGDYDSIENITATWFIDPPYQYGGEHYVESNNSLDYKKLADWCTERNGQVIVCENTKADWLPFRPLASYSGQNHTTTEAQWTKGQPEQIALIVGKSSH